MPRIFKGSESTLRLLISKTGDYQALTEIKIKLYTTDIENAIEIIDGIQVCKNIAIITLAPRAFMGMEDGLINYIIDGATEDDVFHTERQSNYMLKSLSYINEDGVATQTMTIESNGEYRVTPNDGLYVDINVNVPDLNGSYDEGYAEGEGVGYNQGKTDGANEQKSKLESINITENGTYTKEDGYNHIEVNVPDLNGSYDEGYAQGKTDGVNEQKSKLESISITENGTYTKEDGYNHIEVNVPDLNGSYNEGYGQGKADGISEQKSKLETISITENGTYSKEDGYNHIEVNVPDLNGSYDEGKTDSVNEQKSKLESINITENGVYSKEDGYNHIEVNVADLNGSYDEGYNQGQADVAANARVLNVTENGNYLSKFSDHILPTVTGVYDDGTDFYNYAELTNITYNTGIKVSENTKIEIWYKPRELGFLNYGGIIGTAEDNTSEAFSLNTRIDEGFIGKITNLNYNYKPNDLNKWFHLELSFADGFVVDGVNYGTYQNNITNFNRYIFINDYDLNANGYFGMIKIDNTTIIPTADGFKNVNTGKLLEVAKDGAYIFTENLPIYPEGELYKTINVNVLPKINLQKTGLKLGYSTFTEVPEWADFEGITDMESMFNDCQNIKTIPLIDTSNITNMSYMLNGCRNLQTIPLINTSNVTNMRCMFQLCYKLQTIPQIDTSNVTNMDSMFFNCNNLTSLPALNAQSLNMPSYQGIFGYNELSNLTDFGGFLNLKYSLTNDSNLKKLPNLTYQSCINVLNGLYDFTGNGETPGSNQGQLKVHQNFLDKVGEEISIGTNKGWQITV